MVSTGPAGLAPCAPVCTLDQCDGGHDPGRMGRAPATGDTEAAMVAEATCCWCHATLVESEEAWWCSGSTDCQKRQMRFATERQDAQGSRIGWLYVPTPVQTTWHEATLLRGV